MKTHSQKFLQQRRFYMVLPLLVMPFVTMIFWALGGGQGTAVQAKEVKSGLNMELPGAHFDKEDELWDKFALYEQAKRDSLKYEEAKRNDPYYVVSTLKSNASQDTIPKDNKLNTSLGHKDKYAQIDKHEEIINQKLEQLTRQLNQPEKVSSGSKTILSQRTEINTPLSSSMTSDVDRLEQMMEMMSSSDARDPEMQQIESVLEKILDVQHPDRVREKIKEQSVQHKTQVFAVEAAQSDDNITIVGNSHHQNYTDSLSTLIDISRSSMRHDFYGLDDEINVSESTSNAIEAVIHDTQTIVAGSTIKMRLLSDVYIHGQLIERDQFVYGVCAINGERLTITINSIRDEHSLLPVSLSVYDLDGMEGIYVPGAITRDAAKQASSQSIQDVQLYSMDNSLGVQAATAGVEAVKGLLAKKAKLIKVTVKAGYQILLRDKNQEVQ
jgi:conjugative transposon TraM protein